MDCTSAIWPRCFAPYGGLNELLWCKDVTDSLLSLRSYVFKPMDALELLRVIMGWLVLVFKPFSEFSLLGLFNRVE